MRIESLAIHAGAETDAATGAVTPPIHLSTTFQHGPAGERLAGYEYTREGNPTQTRLEEALATLEGGASALAFGSGMAATDAILSAFPDGSHILIPRDVYHGTRVLAREFLARLGMSLLRCGDLRGGQAKRIFVGEGDARRRGNVDPRSGG